MAKQNAKQDKNKNQPEGEQLNAIRKLIEGKKNPSKEDIYNQPTKWDLKEKEVLMKMVEVYGKNDWEVIAKHLPGRKGFECA